MRTGKGWVVPRLWCERCALILSQELSFPSPGLRRRTAVLGTQHPDSTEPSGLWLSSDPRVVQKVMIWESRPSASARWNAGSLHLTLLLSWDLKHVTRGMLPLATGNRYRTCPSWQDILWDST